MAQGSGHLSSLGRAGLICCCAQIPCVMLGLSPRGIYLGAKLQLESDPDPETDSGTWSGTHSAVARVVGGSNGSGC